jgi:hypothetical protein
MALSFQVPVVNPLIQPLVTVSRCVPDLSKGTTCREDLLSHVRLNAMYGRLPEVESGINITDSHHLFLSVTSCSHIDSHVP